MRHTRRLASRAGVSSSASSAKRSSALPDATIAAPATDTAAGELLRAAKAAVQSWPSGAAEINALRDAIEAAERAGIGTDRKFLRAENRHQD